MIQNVYLISDLLYSLKKIKIKGHAEINILHYKRRHNSIEKLFPTTQEAFSTLKPPSAISQYIYLSTTSKASLSISQNQVHFCITSHKCNPKRKWIHSLG
jgi:hypothetical protein